MHAVVTGGSRGIGAAVVELLHAHGWQVTDWSRAHGIDVTDRRRLRIRLDHLAPVDALVSNAGDVTVGSIVDTDLDEWDTALRVNLLAHVQLLRWFAATQRPGRIVLVASTAGQRPSPGWAPYAAAKAALINLGLTAHAELSERGHQVFTVAPGRTATALRARLVPGEDPSTIQQPVDVATVIARCLLDDTYAAAMAGRVIPAVTHRADRERAWV